MNSSDIQIGEKYLVNHGRCAKVLETRLELTNWNGTVRKEGVKVLYQGGAMDGQEKVIPSRKVQELWSHHQERERAQQLRRKVAAQDRQRSEELVTQLKQALRANGIEVRSCRVGYGYHNGERSHYGDIGLDDNEIKKLISLLSSPQMNAKPEANDSNPLAELLG